MVALQKPSETCPSSEAVWHPMNIHTMNEGLIHDLRLFQKATEEGGYHSGFLEAKELSVLRISTLY